MGYGLNRYPGVWEYRKPGHVLYLRYKDPRTGKIIGPRSAETTDRKEFDQICRQIHDICSQGLLTDPPEGTLTVVLKILNIETANAQDTKKANASFGALAHDLIKESQKNKKIQRLWSDASGFAKVYHQMNEQLKTIKGLRALLSSAQTEANRWKTKALAYEQARMTEGKALLENAEKPFLTALSEWHKATGGREPKWRKTKWNYVVSVARHCWSELHAQSQGMEYEDERDLTDLKLSDLTDARLKSYMEGLKDRTDDGSVRQQINTLNSFMQYHLGSYWRSEPVVRLRKSIRSEIEPLTPSDWLEPEEAHRVISGLPEYWRNVAILQRAMGWRGEELSFLLASGWNEEAGTLQVLKIEHEGHVVRAAKNRRAYRAVPVPKGLIPIVKMLIQRNPGGPLFPKTADAGSNVSWSRTKVSDFEREQRLWTKPRWNTMYSKALQASAQAAGISQSKQIGVRILRHTCGREIALKQGLEACAAILRNSISIVQRHYADLLPTDFSPD